MNRTIYTKLALFRFLIFVLSSCITASSLAAERNVPLQGFNWYNEKPELKKEKEKKPLDTKEQAKPSMPELPEYEKNIRFLQDSYKKAHRRALDNPTDDNLREDIRLTNEMMRKSQIYAERRVAMNLKDARLTDMKHHSNVQHKKIQEEVDAKDMAKKLSKLSDEWGLVVQINEECPHCHAFAPIVLEFADKYDFQVLAASKTGRDFRGIEGVLDSGEMITFNPTGAVPMLYLVKSDGKQVFLISPGLHSEDQIIMNIEKTDKYFGGIFK